MGGMEVHKQEGSGQQQSINNKYYLTMKDCCQHWIARSLCLAHLCCSSEPLREGWGGWVVGGKEQQKTGRIEGRPMDLHCVWHLFDTSNVTVPGVPPCP
jgi:hypothetical protein